MNIGETKAAADHHSHDCGPDQPEETCAHHVLLNSLASLISLYNLGAGDVRRKECREAWIDYVIKMYKYILKMLQFINV